MVTLKFDTDNDAFTDDAPAEVARILREVASRIEAGVYEGKIRDANGNTVGSYDATDADELSGAPDDDEHHGEEPEELEERDPIPDGDEPDHYSDADMAQEGDDDETD